MGLDLSCLLDWKKSEFVAFETMTNQYRITEDSGSEARI